ncbi:pol, partial [Symbiodinium sp. KB8]
RPVAAKSGALIKEALKEALTSRRGQKSITSVKTDLVWPTLTDDKWYISDPEAVYTRIKNKHLMFGESREEREVRVDGEHQALMKGKLTGYQFEPLFEASIADLEAEDAAASPGGDSRGQTHLARRRRDVGLRSPATWDECHKVVLEYEQRE